MMKRQLAFVALIAVAGSAVAQSAGYVPGEVLVKFKPGYAMSEFVASRQLNAVKVESVAGIGVSRMLLPAGMSVERAIQFYRSNPAVEFAEPNGIVSAYLVPNDTNYNSQWALPKIAAPSGWNLSTGSTSVIIAIVDTGVSTTHPDLASKLVAGKSFISGVASTNDDNGHGSHCAGIAAAVTNNARGVAGVGWNCRVMPVKVLNGSGSGTMSGVASGITWAAQNGAKVISLSLGGGSSSTLQSAVNSAWSMGAVVVAAAGNSSSQTPSYPAGYTNAIAVGSTTSTDARSSFSNYGSSWVDVAAPGSSIYSTYKGTQYATMSGTSMATPHVAGLAGLIWSKYPGTTNTQVRARIENGCDSVGAWVAKGRINVLKALQ